LSDRRRLPPFIAASMATADAISPHISRFPTPPSAIDFASPPPPLSYFSFSPFFVIAVIPPYVIVYDA